MNESLILFLFFALIVFACPPAREKSISYVNDYENVIFLVVVIVDIKKQKLNIR